VRSQCSARITQAINRTRGAHEWEVHTHDGATQAKFIYHFLIFSFLVGPSARGIKPEAAAIVVCVYCAASAHMYMYIYIYYYYYVSVRWGGIAGRGSTAAAAAAAAAESLFIVACAAAELLDKSIVRASIVLNQMRIHLSLVFHSAHSVPSCSILSLSLDYNTLCTSAYLALALFVPAAQRAEAAATAASPLHHLASIF
jgi:hypothetical protein